MKKGIYIDGKWVISNDTIDVVNPYDGSTVETVSIADEQQFEKAVQVAVKTYERSRKLKVHEKTKALLFISQELENRKEDISKTLTMESGKLISDSRAEVDRSVMVFRLAAEILDTAGGEVMPLDITDVSGDRFGIIKRFPIGPILGISPFNFPLNLVSHKVAPAIATGNPIILKPASSTPLSALKLAEIFNMTELPKGMFQVLPCSRQTANKFIEDERFRMISFTGSAGVGWDIKDRARKKKVVLELGGDAGVYVHKDADLDHAIKRILLGSFAFSGQICISVQRILVHKDVYDEFKVRFIKEVEGLKIGDPMDDENDLGPMIDEKNAKRIIDWIGQAKEQGTEVAVGGFMDERGFVSPTVLLEPPESCLIVSEEAFAPIVNLYKVDSAREALERIDLSKYGLQTGIFTNNQNLIFDAFEELEVGGIVINDIPTFRVDNMPYGGVKDSGFGREGLKYAMDDMTEPKILVINRNIKNEEDY